MERRPPLPAALAGALDRAVLAAVRSGQGRAMQIRGAALRALSPEEDAALRAWLRLGRPSARTPWAPLRAPLAASLQRLARAGAIRLEDRWWTAVRTLVHGPDARPLGPG